MGTKKKHTFQQQENRNHTKNNGQTESRKKKRAQIMTRFRCQNHNLDLHFYDHGLTWRKYMTKLQIKMFVTKYFTLQENELRNWDKIFQIQTGRITFQWRFHSS